MSIEIHTPVKTECRPHIEQIIERFAWSSKQKGGIELALNDNLFSMRFSGGFQTKIYYGLCYLIKELACRYGIPTQDGLHGYYDDESVVILKSDRQPLSDQQRRNALQWFKDNLLSEAEIPDVNIESECFISGQRYPLLSKAWRHQRVALPLLDILITDRVEQPTDTEQKRNLDR